MDDRNIEVDNCGKEETARDQAQAV